MGAEGGGRRGRDQIRMGRKARMSQIEERGEDGTRKGVRTGAGKGMADPSVFGRNRNRGL